MLGLESTGDNTQDIAFQEYLKLTKPIAVPWAVDTQTRHCRLQPRHATHSDNNFVYSNARQTAAGLNMGKMGEALNAIPKAQGELKMPLFVCRLCEKSTRRSASCSRAVVRTISRRFCCVRNGQHDTAFAVSFPYLTQFTSVKIRQRNWDAPPRNWRSAIPNTILN